MGNTKQTVNNNSTEVYTFFYLEPLLSVYFEHVVGDASTTILADNVQTLELLNSDSN